MMDLLSTQDKALENYFDALLFAEDGSSFNDAKEVSPLFSVKESLNEMETVRADSLNASRVDGYNESTPQAGDVPIDQEHLKTDGQSIAAEPDEYDGMSVITRSMTDDKFLFIQPMTVVGLRLALPMDRVSETLSIEGLDLEVMPDEGKPLYGILSHAGRRIPVLNTAAIVLPENHPRYEAMLARKNYQKIILVDQGRLALAVDDADEEVYLPTDNIRWSESSSNYTWLAGTLTDYGYALINAERLAGYLMS